VFVLAASTKKTQLVFRHHGSNFISGGGWRRSNEPNGKAFTAEEKRELAVNAVNRLIADAEAKRLPENKELTETIAACISEADERHLRALK
jgi:hypothetical protein